MSRHGSGDHFLRQNLKRDYPMMVRGKGYTLWDDKGREYVDGASGGVGAVLIGHGIPEVVKAMTEQAHKLCHAHISMFVNEPQIELANFIIEAFAPQGMSHVYFVSTGTESNELAVKLARIYHMQKGNGTRFKIVCRWHGYHGSSLGALSYSGRSIRRGKFHPYYFDSAFMSPAYCYRCPYEKTYPGCGLRCAWELERIIQHEGTNTISAFIGEPYVNTAGALGAPPEYYGIIRQICDKYDILMIMDEVITGWGRTGANFGINHWGVVPDFICTGKGIASGYAPLAATMVHEKVVRVLEETGESVEGYTYGGNPLSCATGLAVLKYIKDYKLVERAAEEGATFQSRAKSLLEFPIVGDVRGKGMLLGVEYVTDKNSRKPFPRDKKLCETITDIAFQKGLVTCPISGGANGVDGDATAIKPPLTTPKEILDQIFDIMAETLAEVQKNYL
jgi:adenosylmethionine-8-amino-7-oxononanoate aminotransferase